MWASWLEAATSAPAVCPALLWRPEHQGHDKIPNYSIVPVEDHGTGGWNQVGACGALEISSGALEIPNHLVQYHGQAYAMYHVLNSPFGCYNCTMNH